MCYIRVFASLPHYKGLALPESLAWNEKEKKAPNWRKERRPKEARGLRLPEDWLPPRAQKLEPARKPLCSPAQSLISSLKPTWDKPPSLRGSLLFVSLFLIKPIYHPHPIHTSLLGTCSAMIETKDDSEQTSNLVLLKSLSEVVK